MNKQTHWHAARLRQLRYTAKQLNRLTKNGISPARLLRKLERQWNYLNGRFSTRSLSRLLSGAALMFVMGTAQGQISFAPAVSNPASYTPAGAQGYQYLSTADLDNDGDFDMMIGDPYGGNLNYFENTGTSTSPTFAAATQNPFGLVGGSGVVSAHFADIDGDGDMDAFVSAVNYGTYALDLYYQENTGTANAPAFGPRVQSPFGITTGVYDVHFAFGDMDNDGDLDIFIGSGYSGNISYFQNTGSATAPAFGAAQVNPFGLQGSTYYQSAPVLLDLDSDGDLDMMVAEYYGAFRYFENTGTNTAPAFGTPVPSPFGLPGANYSLDFVGLSGADMDADGDVDLLMSTYGGALSYFENTTPTAPAGPVLEFNSASLTFTEGNLSRVGLPVNILNPDNNTTTADVRIGMGGTATNGDDYTFSSPTQVSFTPNGPMQDFFYFDIIDDMLVEPDETIIFELTNLSSNASLGNNAVLTLIIQNDDIAEVRFAGVSEMVFENSTSYDIVATLSNPLPQQVQVDIAIDGASTATDGQDFSLSATSFVFPANTTAQQTVTVNITDDSDIEGNESLILNLTNPTGGAVIGNSGSFSLEILDDDYAVGIDRLATAFGLSVSPNPAQDVVEIRMKQPVALSCTLTDLQGKLVKRMELQSLSNRLHVGELRPGLYILHFQGEQHQGSLKLIVK